MATAVVAGQALTSAKGVIVPILIGAVSAFGGWWFEVELRDFITSYPWLLPLVIFFAASGLAIFFSIA